ncbi:MAG: hypothetical protein RQ826_00585 [Xanthomonadales bacterium]|nr:hypothetical protein [Xanthomonadales bacterium]
MGFALSGMQLTSPAFEQGGRIPTTNTGEGEDVSPAQSWSDVPDSTRAFAVICHDPDTRLVAKGCTLRQAAFRLIPNEPLMPYSLLRANL